MDRLIAWQVFALRKKRQYFKKYYREKDLERLSNRNTVLVSKNGWGGSVYRHLDLPYNTPFVGLFLTAPDYIKMLQGFEYYGAQPLRFIQESKYDTGLTEKYPTGLLHDVEIHFLHYKDSAESRTKWNRRRERMPKRLDYSNFYFTMCGRRGGTPGLIRASHGLPFQNKISFGLNKIAGLSNLRLIQVHQWPIRKKGGFAQWEKMVQADVPLFGSDTLV